MPTPPPEFMRDMILLSSFMVIKMLRRRHDTMALRRCAAVMFYGAMRVRGVERRDAALMLRALPCCATRR